MEASIRKIRVGKAKGGKRKRRSWEKERKKGKMMEVKKVAEEWEIWNEEEEVARSETKAKKLVPEKFHR